MLNNLKNAASSVKNSVAMTAKNIAAEALETAQELRQIHEEDWSQKVKEEQMQQTSANSLQNESHSPVIEAEAEVEAQPIPPPPISQSQPQPSTTNNDVSARLAALKAKIQADKLKSKQGSASNSPKMTTTSGGDSTTIARPQLQSRQSSSRQSEELTATIQQLKAELERERASQARASESISQERAAAEQATSEVHRLREHLEKMMEENTLLHTQVAASAEAAAVDEEDDDDNDDEATQALMVELKKAREEAAAEKSKVTMLENEMQSLQLVVEQTQAAQLAASLHGINGEDTEAELTALRAECAVLREELERLRASSSIIKKEERDSIAETSAAAMARLTQELEKSESDKAALKQQLVKLKTQMLGDQEDEEEKIKWRVDAEVKLALDKMGRSSSSSAPSPFQSSSTSGGNNNREEIATLTGRCEALERDIAKYEHAAAARESELSNLQKALAELTYESEAAERLRAEARGLTAETRTLRNELDTARLERLALEERVAAAEGSADDAKKTAAELAVSEGKIQGQLLAAQAALAEVKQKESAAEQGALIDRRVLVKMLVSFFQRGQQVEVLELMAKMLGFTDDERDRVFSSFTGGSSTSSGRGGIHNNNNNNGGVLLMEDGDSLAASWVDFLVRQLNEEEGRSNGKATTTTSMTPVL